MKATCRTCRFFQPSPSSDAFGQCRRNPPVVLLLEKLPGRTCIRTTWPEVEQTHWCGEYVENTSLGVPNG